MGAIGAPFRERNSAGMTSTTATTGPAPGAVIGPPPPTRALARRLGAFDATMIVMGGIIGSGIFRNPALVAATAGSATRALTAWAIGGAIALIGAFVYAELADRRPALGGQYAYLRDAYHPMVAFLYGWTLLLVVQTGGMAASALVLGRYARETFGIGAPEQLIAAGALLILTVINCFGVRAGATVQNGFMGLKLLAIATLIGVGFWIGHASNVPVAPSLVPGGVRFGVMVALVPIIFTYGGWQTASFVSGEMKDPRRDLGRGMLLGIGSVVVVYLLVNVVCLRVLGVAGLASTAAPAADVMRIGLGDWGARFISLGITISTLGFLSQSMLTAPRVYHAMASDRVFFRFVGRIDPRTLAPVAAIVLQGAWATIIVFAGGFEQILNYVVSVDTVFFGLTGLSIFIFRARESREPTLPGGTGARVIGHPYTTAVYVAALWMIAIVSITHAPSDAVKGLGILALGVPIYFVWARRGVRPLAPPPE